jgi:hypothetical protein
VSVLWMKTSVLWMKISVLCMRNTDLWIDNCSAGRARSRSGRRGGTGSGPERRNLMRACVGQNRQGPSGGPTCRSYG